MTPYYEEHGVTIYHGDCRELLPQLRHVADMLLTDPPYASAAATATTGWSKQKWGGNWGDMSLVSFMAETVIDSQALDPSHEVLWFCDHLGYAALVPSFFRRYPLVQSIVWDRDVLGMGAYFRKQTEFILYGRKAQAVNFLTRDARDLIRLRPTVADKEHSAQKPVALLLQLLSSSGATRIIDPFLGSGSTLVAAKLLGKQAIGIEIEERYCEVAARRLRQGVFDLAEVDIGQVQLSLDSIPD